MSDLLTARNLCKSYPSGNQRLEVLVNLSLDVAEREMVAITGVSGSGKSTLLHLVGGMDRADGGHITIQGVELSGLRREELCRFRNRTIGFVFQFHHLLPEFTAIENAAMPALIAGLSREAATKKAAELLDRVGLSQRLRHRPGELSGGEQQRVALARALVMEPQLLLADEPTGNLDRRTGAAIHDLLLELNRERGMTLLVVTHNDDLAIQLPRQL